MYIPKILWYARLVKHYWLSSANSQRESMAKIPVDAGRLNTWHCQQCCELAGRISCWSIQSVLWVSCLMKYNDCDRLVSFSKENISAFYQTFKVITLQLICVSSEWFFTRVNKLWLFISIHKKSSEHFGVFSQIQHLFILALITVTYRLIQCEFCKILKKLNNEPIYPWSRQAVNLIAVSSFTVAYPKQRTHSTLPPSKGIWRLIFQSDKLKRPVVSE